MLPAVKTPQFRTLLIRKLKNLFPQWSAHIEDAPRGITFQLFDRDGHARSGRISLYRTHPKVLTKRSLSWEVEKSKL